VDSVSPSSLSSFKSPARILVPNLCDSRNAWRVQARNLRVKCRQLEEELKKAKENIQELQAELVTARREIAREREPQWARERPLPHHQYSARIISMYCNLSKVTGFRAAPEVVKIINESLNMQIPVASHDAVKNWNCRNGVAILQRPGMADDWIWMIDHSVQLGKMCVLAVIAIRRKHLPKDRPLKREDMMVLAVLPAKSRNKEVVVQQLKAVALKFGRPLAVICDGAAELRYAVSKLKTKNRPVVCLHDTKHKIASCLKTQLGKSKRWVEFESRIGSTISQLQQTELDHLTPPARKQKCRFMNLRPIIQWSISILEQLERADCPIKLREKAGWVLEFAADIYEWLEVWSMIDRTLIQANTKGVWAGAAAELRGELSVMPASTHWATAMREEMISIVAQNEAQLMTLSKRDLVLPASTEILESAFGSFKAIQRTHCRGTFTSLLAVFPTLFDHCTARKIRDRFRQVTNEDLKAWIAEAGLCNSTQARKVRAAKDGRRKQRVTMV
jgi:hypothetical protein